MAISFSTCSLLHVTILITTTSLHLISAAESLPPSQPPSLPPTPPSQPPLSAAQSPPPPPPSSEIQERRLNNIIDALIGAGDFGGWVNLLSTADPSSLPLTATFFIPRNGAVSAPPFDPFLIPYHIIPQRLTFSELQKFATHTRLPTLLPDKSIVVTNNSPGNFSVDGSKITEADIFLNAAFSVHGVEKVLDYSIYGGENLVSPPPENDVLLPARPNPTKKRNPAFPGQVTVGIRSDGESCLCDWINLMIFPTLCGALIFKIV